ncbi:MAG: threonine-phosphate decarboxylase CobD [Cyanobacteriota bacterium ELA615]
MVRPTHGGNRDWAATLAGCSISEILDFSASINPLGPPKSLFKALEESFLELTHYPDPNYGQLRSALAQKHALSPDWILPGNGVAELLNWAALELSKLTAVNLLTPAFADYSRALRTFGAEIVACPMELETGKWQPSSVLGKQMGLLINNPHNPTGYLLGVEALLPLLSDYGLVVVDEAFMDFIEKPESLIPWVEQYPNLVILRSLTKFYSLPGLRLGYAIAHPDRLALWQQWRDPWPVNTIADIAGQIVIKDHDFQQQTWSWLASSSPKFFNQLSNIKGLSVSKSSANFFLVHSQKSVIQLQQKLLSEKRILIRDCLSFKELGEYYFRVAIRTDQENQQLIRALEDYAL